MSATSGPTPDRPLSPSQMTQEELRQEYVQLMTVFYRSGLEEQECKNRIEALRQESVRFQQNIEVEEEYATNRLLRRLHGAERDLSVYQETVQEEEAAVREIEEQIRAVRRQKATIESQLEERQEYQLNDLQKKLLNVAAQKSGVEHELQKEQQRYLALLLRLLNSLRRRAELPAAGTTSSPNETVATGAATVTATTNAELVSEDEGVVGVCVGRPTGATTFSVVSARHTPRTGSEIHERVITLEHRLNKLLQEQTAAVQKSIANERRCAELAEKLDYVQSDVFIKRAKAAKLREDLNEARQQLDQLGPNPVVNASFGEFSLGTTPNLSMDASGVPGALLSVRDRTKELLSSATTQPQPLSARHERGGSM